ncbi:glycosyltransferase family 25 protein [Rhodomicrobium sp. Az07]|uniref:glycosyltransferase family 25 protein n=1 Tax=Rhodomicrobium sp. Az07 TaxID=2839034 RepID=UPI001BE95479|nr:glycosyltransferase family 25 protein [Rhodomicrobium sp. Az07]MBT3071705.1 glycosyltransferase family 25 protein [Rhodomicrobium sp. Az07]
MPNPPIFLLNLDSAQHRLAAMKQQLDALGLAFERFPAVAGKLLSADELEAVAPSHLWEGRRRRNPGEIGCFLSHRAILETILARDLPVACILEDDVRLSADFAAILDAARVLPPQVDVLKLEIALPRAKIPFIKVSAFAGRDLVFLPAGGWPGTAAYVVTRRGAKSLLARMPVMIASNDRQAFDPPAADLAIFHLFPLPAVQEGESEMGRPRNPAKAPKPRRSPARVLSDAVRKGLRSVSRRTAHLRFQMSLLGVKKALFGRRTRKRADLVRV